MKLTGETRKKNVYKSRMLLKKIWVLVFSFMYLLSLDPTETSKMTEKGEFIKKKYINLLNF